MDDGLGPGEARELDTGNDRRFCLLLFLDAVSMRIPVGNRRR